MTSIDANTETPLGAAELHRVVESGRILLFGVSSLKVLDVDPLDELILTAASPSCPASSLNELYRTGGLSPRSATERLDRLIEAGLLLINGNQPAALGEAPRPSYCTFMINVAQRCNLSCAYCFVREGSFEYSSPPLPFMEAEVAAALVGDLLQIFPHLEGCGYHFYGGEPLLNFPAIELITRAAREHSARTGASSDFYITTNGTLLTEEMADFFDEHSFTVYISIDPDAVLHDSLRPYARGGKGSFATAASALSRLRSRGRIHIIGSSVVTGGASLAEAIRSLGERGVHQCKVECARMADSESLVLSGDERSRYLKELRALSQHYISAIEDRSKPLDLRLSSRILQLLLGIPRPTFCPAGDRMFGIACNGEIYPCALHAGRRESLLGNLGAGLNQSAAAAFRLRHSAAGRKACAGCWARLLCGGGCSAMTDRFGRDDCEAIKAESEAAIAVFAHFSAKEPLELLRLVSPSTVDWLEDLEPRSRPRDQGIPGSGAT